MRVSKQCEESGRTNGPRAKKLIEPQWADTGRTSVRSGTDCPLGGHDQYFVLLLLFFCSNDGLHDHINMRELLSHSAAPLSFTELIVQVLCLAT